MMMFFLCEPSPFQICWVARQRPIARREGFFQRLRPATSPREALGFARGKSCEFFNTETHKTRGWSSHTSAAVHANGIETTRGDEEERDTQTEGAAFIFLSCIPFSPLTLLGLTALCRFSIHLSLSAAERHAKHLVPEAVVT